MNWFINMQCLALCCLVSTTGNINPVPANAVKDENGNPIKDENGNYILQD